MWWVHKNFTPTNRKLAEEYAPPKNVFHLRWPREIGSFCESQSLSQRAGF
jgi:hypothetical protein